ncbi:hypothetical protein O181_011017 [Austropuccinia psidii MF-1]|uniref:Uncharacterized protein n=1 Tax=Austropuccinia psidii MF-1 TaxID=1389203 RepID=A0A9Q3BUW8_9BASI|nr:hypothetical protein [Austropuccinia psidii MF-1]
MLTFRSTAFQWQKALEEQEGWALWERAQVTGSRQREVARWTNVGEPIPTVGRPIQSSSEVPIPKINNQVVVKRLRQISYSPTTPDSRGSDKLDGEEVEVISTLVGHSSSSSPIQPPSKKFHTNLIPSTPRNFQPVLYSVPTLVPPPSPKSSIYRPMLASPMKPSPIPYPRPSTVLNSHQLQTVARIRRRR